jgi:hypothetical protein
MPTQPNDEIDNILQAYGTRCFNEGYEGSDQQGIGYDEAREAIQRLIVEKQLEAYKHGLLTGAMPEALGKPIAEDYIASLNTKQEGK